MNAALAGLSRAVPRTVQTCLRLLAVLLLSAQVCPGAKQTAQPDSFAELVQRTTSADVNDRLDAVAELGKSERAEAIPALVAALSDSSAAVRTSAADGLHRLPGIGRSADARQALLKLLSDENDRVRASAIWSLSHIGGPGVVDEAVRLGRNDASGVVRFRAVWGLAFLKDRRALPAAVDALGDYNNSVRERSALLAIEALADKTIVPRLITQRRHVLPATRRVVMFLLAKYGRGNRQAMAALDEGLQDPDATVRGEAALSLGKLRSRRSSKLLIAALGDRDEHVRGSAAYALGLIGDKANAASLRPLLNDSHAFVRAVTAESLQLLGDKTARPPSGFRAAELFTFPIHTRPDVDN